MKVYKYAYFQEQLAYLDGSTALWGFRGRGIFFSDKLAEHHKKIKELLKHMYMKRFTENLGWCSAHLKKLKIKKNQTNVKLTAAHQY